MEIEDCCSSTENIHYSTLTLILLFAIIYVHCMIMCNTLCHETYILITETIKCTDCEWAESFVQDDICE